MTKKKPSRPDAANNSLPLVADHASHGVAEEWERTSDALVCVRIRGRNDTQKIIFIHRRAEEGDKAARNRRVYNII